ncbi:MAG: hypothetical protein WBG86_18485 [Polyangiales bacterium]
MTTTLIAAVVVGLLAPVLRGLMWGVPFSLLSIGMVIASFVGSVLTALVIGAAASVVLRFTSLTPGEMDTLSGIIAGLGALVLLWSSARRMREVRGLSLLCQRLAEEDARSVALQSLRRLLDRAARRDRGRHAGLVLMATGPLTQSSHWSEAREQLAAIDDSALEPTQAMLRNQALATCHLHFDDTEAARLAIEKISRPAEDSIEVWLVAMEALLLAVTGNSEAAGAKLRDQDTEDNPSLEASHRLVRAHILAAEGRHVQAREELDWLLRAAGRTGLERVLKPRGPATELAQSMLAEHATATPQA